DRGTLGGPLTGAALVACARSHLEWAHSAGPSPIGRSSTTAFPDKLLVNRHRRDSSRLDRRSVARPLVPPSNSNNFLPTAFFRCANPPFSAEYRSNSVAGSLLGDEEGEIIWQRWTRLGRKSSGFPSAWRESRLNGRSWLINSMNWKSPNAF